jgi:hypothetical protein
VGISYRGVIAVGYTYSEAEDIMNSTDTELDFYDWSEDEGLERSGPYYDADTDDCIFGEVVVSSSEYSTVELSANLPEQIGNAVVKLEKQFGVTPKVYLMAEGS